MSNPLDQQVIDYLRTIDGSTAWAMQGSIGEDREAISKVLYRLKRKGLVVNRGTYWLAVKP